MIDKSAVGTKGKPFTMPIEWGKVREFARAIKDPNPVYFDPAAAKKECGGIPIPVTFLMTSSFWQGADSSPMLNVDLRRVLHGEQEFEFLKPVFVGDTLTGVAHIRRLRERGRARRQDELPGDGDRVPQPARRAGGDRPFDRDRDRSSRQGELTNSTELCLRVIIVRYGCFSSPSGGPW